MLDFVILNTKLSVTYVTPYKLYWKTDICICCSQLRTEEKTNYYRIASITF